MSVKDRLVRGGAAMLALRAFSMVLMLVLSGCLTRWMTPSEVASYVAGTNVLLLVSLIGMVGFNQSILRIVSGKTSMAVSNRRLIFRCWMVVAVSSVLAVTVFYFLLRTSLGRWLDCDPNIILALLTCSLLVTVHKLLAASLRSIHAIASSSILEGRSGGPLANSLFLPIAAILAIGGLNSNKAFCGFALALVLTGPIGFWILRRALLRTDDSEENEAASQKEGTHQLQAKRLIWLSMPFLMTQVLAYFATEFDVLLAKAYTTPEDTAVFGSCRRLILQVLAPMQIITASVGSTIAELYAKGDEQRLRKMLRYLSTAGCVVTFPLLALCVLFPKQILSLVFGGFYGSGATIFVILAIGQAVNCLTGQCGNLLMLSGRTTTMLIIRTLGAIAMVVVGSLMAQWHGVVGLAIATTVVLCVQNIIAWLFARFQAGYWPHPTLDFRGMFKALRRRKRK